MKGVFVICFGTNENVTDLDRGSRYTMHGMSQRPQHLQELLCEFHLTF